MAHTHTGYLKHRVVEGVDFAIGSYGMRSVLPFGAKCGEAARYDESTREYDQPEKSSRRCRRRGRRGIAACV